jgi:hypothetical protein
VAKLREIKGTAHEIEKKGCFGIVNPERMNYEKARRVLEGSPVIIRIPCYAKSSRSFVSNRGLADPNPGFYRASFRKSRESEPV